jgi:Prp8 binding protein
MRPYAPANRCVKVFTGHSHSFEKNPLKCDWSPDGTKVTHLPLRCLFAGMG